MKSMSASARGFLLVALSLLGALGGCENQPSYLTYLSTVTGTTESVPIPDHAIVSSAELSADAAGPSESPVPSESPTPSSTPEPVSTLNVTMAASQPADLTDPLVVVSYLRNETGEDRAIVLGIRTAAPFSNWLPDGYGAIVDPASRAILEIQPLTLTGPVVSATFSPWLLVGYSLEYTRSHWLPSTVQVESVVGGLAGAHSGLTGYDPGASMAQVDLPDVDCSSYVSSGALVTPRSANASCPPRRRDNVTDIDLDGRPNTKHDREVIYNNSVTPLGNGKLFVTIGIIRPNPNTGRADGSSSSFVATIVDDTDGDGQADPEEVKKKRKGIGQCVYGRGSNVAGRNGNIITWTCTDMDARGRPTGHQTRFEYNLDTGKLKTFVTDPGGTEQVPNPSFPP